MGAFIHSVFAQLSSARLPRQYVSLCEEANGCPPANWLWNWLWNWQWNCHDDVPTVHATSACPDYGSPAVHATSACPDYRSPADDGSASICADYGSPAVLHNLLQQHGCQAGKGSIRGYRWHGLPSPAVHATSACPDYGSPAVHSTSACPEFCSPADDGSAGTSPDY